MPEDEAREPNDVGLEAGSPASELTEPYNGIKAAAAEIRRRLREPTRHFTFFVYGIIAVAGLGGLAIWVEIGRYFNAPHPRSVESLKLALATAFPAILAGPALEMILKEAKVVRCIALLCIAFCLILVLFLLVQRPSDFVAVGLGWFGCAFSIFVWWIASADNPALQDFPDPDDPTGGVPTRTLATRKTSIRT